jgi:hypothetical protein
MVKRKQSPFRIENKITTLFKVRRQTVSQSAHSYEILEMVKLSSKRSGDI